VDTARGPRARLLHCWRCRSQGRQHDRVDIRGNAFLAEEYPKGSFDFVVSTGLGEFLKADEIEVFYRNAHCILAPGGVFYTSATRYEKRSEAFLETFELLTQYRTIDDLGAAGQTPP
jgi:hypothetical protein